MFGMCDIAKYNKIDTVQSIKCSNKKLIDFPFVLPINIYNCFEFYQDIRKCVENVVNLLTGVNVKWN